MLRELFTITLSEVSELYAAFGLFSLLSPEFFFNSISVSSMSFFDEATVIQSNCGCVL